MSLDFAAVHRRIAEILTAVDTPQFTVIHGNPIALPADGSPFCAYWYDGHTDPPEGRMTLSQRMNAYRYGIRCFWHRQPEAVTQENFQVEIATAEQAIRTAFAADFTLNGLVTSSLIEDGEQPDPSGFFPLQARNGVPTAWYYTIDFGLVISDLEGEALVA